MLRSVVGLWLSMVGVASAEPDLAVVVGVGKGIEGKDHGGGSIIGAVVGARSSWTHGMFGYDAGLDWRPLLINGGYYESGDFSRTEFHVSRYRAMLGGRYYTPGTSPAVWGYVRVAGGIEYRTSRWERQFGGPDTKGSLTSFAPAFDVSVGLQWRSNDWSYGVALGIPVAIHSKEMVNLFGSVDEGEITADVELTVVIGRTL